VPIAAPPIVFFGTSGHAVSLRELMRRTQSCVSLYDVVAYIDDFRGDRGMVLDGAPVIAFETWRRELRDVPCLITIGAPTARRTIAQRLLDAGGALPAVYDRDEVGDVVVGAGSYIATGVRPEQGARIGAFAQIMPFVQISAHAAIGEFVTLCPRVTISGHVAIGDGAFVGAGAEVSGDAEAPVRIGCEALVSAGTRLRTSVGDGRRVFGDPVREIAGMHVVTR
jgi:serine acetyltransferase